MRHLDLCGTYSRVFASVHLRLKMARGLLSDDEAETSDDQVGGIRVEEGLKVNQEYAKRFEHNKKREELQKRKCVEIFV